MGLIKEPRDIDFFVIDKPWSEIELKEFSELIKQQKTLIHKGKIKRINTNIKLKKTNKKWVSHSEVKKELGIR
jgi:uncharacterized protein YqgV (UPF0045/DUF77 family)